MKYAHMYISHTICIFCVCTICIRVLALNMSNATENNSEKTREREREIATKPESDFDAKKQQVHRAIWKPKGQAHKEIVAKY